MEDGSYFYLIQKIKTLRLWSSEGKPLSILKGHTGEVSGVKILKDGHIFILFRRQKLYDYGAVLEIY